MREKADGVPRIDSRQNARVANDPGQSKDPDNCEPEHHDRPKGAADLGGPEPLNGKEDNQNPDGDGHHERLERAGDDIDPFERAQHRNSRRDDAVAIEQGRAQKAHCSQDLAPALEVVGSDQRHQGENAAFAVVVGAHNQQAVFDRDGDDQCPDDQRQDAQRALGGEVSPHCLRHSLQRVERAGAQIPIDDAQRRQRRQRRPAFGALGL